MSRDSPRTDRTSPAMRVAGTRSPRSVVINLCPSAALESRASGLITGSSSGVSHRTGGAMMMRIVRFTEL
jgi:hypothetical protein